MVNSKKISLDFELHFYEIMLLMVIVRLKLFLISLLMCLFPDQTITLLESFNVMQLRVTISLMLCRNGDEILSFNDNAKYLNTFKNTYWNKKNWNLYFYKSIWLHKVWKCNHILLYKPDFSCWISPPPFFYRRLKVMTWAVLMSRAFPLTVIFVISDKMLKLVMRI